MRISCWKKEKSCSTTSLTCCKKNAGLGLTGDPLKIEENSLFKKTRVLNGEREKTGGPGKSADNNGLKIETT
jgi:hypothetical protein